MTPASPWSGATRKQIVVRVSTDEGVDGHGRGLRLRRPARGLSIIEESLAPLLVGQDPTQIERCIDRMHRGTMIYGRRGLAMFAISGVEIALWDLLGKARGAPVYQLLGGALPAAPARLREPDALRHAGRRRPGGMPALRSPGLPACSSCTRSTWPRCRPRARRSGPDVELMLDTNCPWTVRQDAIAHGPRARALSPVLAGGAGVAARGLRGPGARGGRPPRTPIALRRERVDGVRLPRDHRRWRRPISCSRASPRWAASAR